MVGDLLISEGPSVEAWWSDANWLSQPQICCTGARSCDWPHNLTGLLPRVATSLHPHVRGSRASNSFQWMPGWSITNLYCWFPMGGSRFFQNDWKPPAVTPLAGGLRFWVRKLPLMMCLCKPPFTRYQWPLNIILCYHGYWSLVMVGNWQRTLMVLVRIWFWFGSPPSSVGGRWWKVKLQPNLTILCSNCTVTKSRGVLSNRWSLKVETYLPTRKRNSLKISALLVCLLTLTLFTHFSAMNIPTRSDLSSPPIQNSFYLLPLTP